MKTWLDALGTCTAAGGSVGGGPVPDSGASPDIPRPPYDLASCRQDAPEAPGPQLAAGAGLLFATRRCLAAAACREWPLQIDISAQSASKSRPASYSSRSSQATPTIATRGIFAAFAGVK